MWPCSSGPTTSSGRRWDFSEPSWGSDNPPDALHEPKELALSWCHSGVPFVTGGAEIRGAILDHDRTHHADEGLIPTVLELARAATGRAGQAGPLVPPFFRSFRAVSRALAPILCTRSRTSNSVLPRS